jgi:stearoyl-CoA desaturase (delta-9 desaturase)
MIDHRVGLLCLQIVAHVGLISMLFWATWPYWLLTVIGYFFMSCIGASVGYHRLFSHRSFEPPKWFENVCVHAGNLAGMGSSLSWVATHRAHHHHTDKSDQDPHSPHHHKWYEVLWLGMFEPVHVRYVKDLLRDARHLWWHKNYFWVHITVAATGMVISPALYASLILAPQALSWTVGGALNYANHMWGYRNHSTTDNSTNNWIFAVVYWGEGWHNNHHANPKKWNFGERWWEIDVSGCIIRLVQKKLT